TVAARLHAGDNAVLLKIAHGSGRLGFSLRITDDRGAPLLALARTARPPSTRGAVPPIAAPSPEGTPRAKEPALSAPPDAIAELKQAAEAAPQDARAQEDLGILLAYRRPDDDTDRLA